MTKQFVPFPKIGQFRQVVKKVCESSAYVGKDSEGNAIMDYTLPKPTVTFTGTVKLHGTNAGVCYDPVTGALYAQSRSRVIDVDKDNAGFAFFVESNKDSLISICKEYDKGDGSLVTVFGEWCGGNIQKGVALTQLTKMFVVFAVKVGDCWVEFKENLEWDFSNIHNILDFPTYSVDIDFNKPDMVVPTLQSITLNVEEECPVGVEFGVSGIGEGVVWSDGSGNIFKVKGEKHSSSKVKVLANVDIEKLNSISDFVEYAVTESRLEQGIEVVFKQQGIDVDIKQLGDFLKWLMRDIVSEEADTLAGNNLEPKDIGKEVSNKARIWFKERYL